MKKLYAVIVSTLVICAFSVNVFAASFYVVQPGDMLWQIAKKFNTTYQEIAKVNNLKDANLIVVGQKLTIPEAAPTVAPAKPATPATPATPAAPAAPAVAPAAGAPAGGKTPPAPPPTPPLTKRLGDFGVLTIGTGGPPPSMEAFGPCTLVYYKDKYFMVDAGGGATYALINAGIPYGKITNMLFTHHHADHNEGYIKWLINSWMIGRPSLNLVGPPDTKKFQDFIIDFYKEDLIYRSTLEKKSLEAMTKANIQEFKGSNTFVLDGVKITTAELTHTLYNLGYRFDVDGKSIVVSGDTAFDEDLITLAKDADILVLDSGPLPNKPGAVPATPAPAAAPAPAPAPAPVPAPAPAPGAAPAAEVKPMLNHVGFPGDVAKIAIGANVKQLVLTHHIMPYKYIDVDSVKKQLADLGFKGEVIVPKEGDEFIPK